jgi:hypothetical protein
MRIRPIIGSLGGVLALAIVLAFTLGTGSGYAAAKLFQPRTFTVASGPAEFDASERFTTAKVSCPSGSVLTGGGGGTDLDFDATIVSSSQYVNNDGSIAGWQITVKWGVDDNAPAVAYAICMHTQ